MRNPQFSSQPLQIRAAILDWAGTTVDFGSRAPVEAFLSVFSGLDIHVSTADARGPMGRAKRDHLGAIFALPHIAAQWQHRFGHAPTEAEIDAVYRSFVPTQLAVLGQFAKPIPGVLDVVAQWRADGIRVGSTTGYTKSMLDIVAHAAVGQGYQPDAMVAGDQTPAGRPAPWMIWQNLQSLGVWPPAAVVKIGDTAADVDEGRNAGCWTVALTACGNEVGLSEAEFAKLDASERDSLVALAHDALGRAGAHYLADSWAEIPGIFADINGRLAAGERP